MTGQPADAALWGTGDSDDHEHGATAADVEAAVPDVDSVADDDSEPTPQRVDSEADPEVTDSERTDDESSASVRDTERRMIVGELLLQVPLALGLVVCVSFVVIRLAQVLL